MVCNADEGEPGTFKDRVIMENDPYLVLEGIMIAAYMIGSNKAYVYIRGEYYDSINKMSHAIKTCKEAGLLGDFILGSDFSLDVEIKPGAGSYLCGEELTLIESLEGKRGYPRIKPPYPAETGLFGKPTLVNNVETLVQIPSIIINGPDWYKSLGTEKSSGTKIFTLSGRINKPGFFEVEMGIRLRELIFDLGGGMKNGFEFKGVLLGGAAGTFVDASMLDIPMAYETLKEKGATLGSGAVIVLDQTQSVTEMLVSILEFFKHESCGKCVPCRVGCAHLAGMCHELLNKRQGKTEILELMEKKARYMAANSLCPLGQSPILPIRSAIQYFKKEITG